MSNELQTMPQNQITASPRRDLTNASAQALVQRTLAEVQVAVMMAKQFPRDKIGAREAIINDCCREELARVAMYSYAKGGSEVTGPSIRLAEALKVAWGNMQSGWRVLSKSREESEVEAWCWDAENNTRESIVFTVRHFRNTKKGSYEITDERDIYELCANNASRRLRACILKMIPGDIIDAAVKQCESTLATKINITPERIQKMVELFAEFGVTKEQLEVRAQRRIDSINAAQMVQFTKIYNSLKDGMSKPDEWFEKSTAEAPEEPKSSGVAAATKEALKARKQSEPEQQTKEPPLSDPETGEVIDPARDRANKIMAALQTAKTEAEFNIILHDNKNHIAALPDDLQSMIDQTTEQAEKRFKK